MKRLRKKLTGLIFCGLLLSLGTLAAGAEAELLLYERNPWLMVIGSDSPIIAFYTDGRMIFRDRTASNRSDVVYKSFRLDEEEHEELRSQMKELDSLQAYYELSHATDQKTTQLLFRSDGKPKQVSAYGGVPREMALFIHFLNILQARAGARAKSWQPSYVEIMLWPFDHARGEPTRWPEEFPGLDSPATIKTGLDSPATIKTGLDSPATIKRGESSYSIYLPASEKQNFLNFMESRQGNAVLLDGKKWSVAARIPFPHEIPSILTATSP
jgi:hypothetical protein